MTAAPAPLVIDLDGTLVHSAPDLHRAVNALLAEAGHAGLHLDAVTDMIGDGARKLVERAFATAGAPLAATALAARFERFLELYGADPVHLTRPYPGVPETLARLRDAGHPMGVCTNKPIAMTRTILERLQLAPFFRAVVGGDSLPERKPDPAPLRATLDGMGAAGEDAVVIGDGRNDVLTARAAGLPVVIMSYGYNGGAARDLGADLVLDRFPDIPDALATLTRT